MASLPAKKVAAILAAVLQHSSETEVSAGPPVTAAASCPDVPPPLWAWVGRQETMHDRVLWQRRHSRSW